MQHVSRFCSHQDKRGFLSWVPFEGAGSIGTAAAKSFADDTDLHFNDPKLS